MSLYVSIYLVIAAMTAFLSILEATTLCYNPTNHVRSVIVIAIVCVLSGLVWPLTAVAKLTR